MKIKFWGVRGSIPCPGPDTVKYGGNTTCIELKFGTPEKQIILDAGSGIRDLGNHMMENKSSKAPIDTDLLLTHTHWDHIMGFPFFAPIYAKETKLRVYGPVSFHDETLKDIVGGQMTYRYFPVNQVELTSRIEYIEIKEGPIDIKNKDIKITTRYANHPVLCLGYRFEYKGKVICTLYDSEPYHNLFCTDPNDPSYDEIMALEGEKSAQEENIRMEKFFAGADLLIRDAQYSKAEYQNSKIGWGHTSMELAIESSQKAGVKSLALFHHEPVNSDAILDGHARRLNLDKPYGNMDVFFAREGMKIEI
ncbi:MAG: MBL fold metallo-hydrolase [Desulfobacteraceae bacterium]|nr:MBL fold metallo-hydrolase [Desulfobacteraceae bacterium]